MRTSILSWRPVWAAAALVLTAATSLPGCGRRTMSSPAEGGVTERGPGVHDGKVGPEGDGARRDGGLRTDGDGGPDELGPRDKGPQPCASMGQVCTSDKSCCGNLTCDTTFTGARICTRSCIPDDPKTPLVIEDTCQSGGSALLCANISSPPNKTYRCMQTCTPTKGKNTCPAGLACDPKSTWMTQTVSKSVCGFSACSSGKDCPVYLSQLCSPGSPIPQCVGPPTGSFCAPFFQGSFGGRCALTGVCDPVGGLCLPHSRGKAAAKVGDPCLDDRDCGGQMECLMEVSTSGTVYFRNGYCSIEGCAFAATFPDRACPAGSDCSKIYYGGRCLKTCNLTQASTCRGQATDKHGDYDCRAWHLYSPSVASSAVCEPGYAAACTLFYGTKATCALLGLASNPTSMACRQPGTGTLLPDYDPGGTCLDTTASGP